MPALTTGVLVGIVVGVFVGVAVGVAVGGTAVLVAVAVGGTAVLVGVAVGVFVGGTGVLVGVAVGVLVGVAVGVFVGVAVGGAFTVVLTVLELAALVSPPPMTLAVLLTAPAVVGLTIRLIVAVPLMVMAVLLYTFCYGPSHQQSLTQRQPLLSALRHWPEKVWALLLFRRRWLHCRRKVRPTFSARTPSPC